MEARTGRQTPTTSVVLPYTETSGPDAIQIYNSTTRQAREWQEILIFDIMAVNSEGLWVHSKFGWEIPRRNGKGEVIVIRELWGLKNGEKIMHTAHRTTTSHSAWERLCMLLAETGLVEGEDYTTHKQFGLETIDMKDGGRISFRTRSSKGGLGEGYDLLVIDEAQEYTIDQESALQYVVSDSPNPQTLFCGTPPTAVSAGTVFVDMRDEVLHGNMPDAGWAEWSIDAQIDVEDMELLMSMLYETNPSLGCGLSERAVLQESRKNVLDFCIQRLGLWIKYNLKSEITKDEWEALRDDFKNIKLKGKIYAGIKYGRDNTNVTMSISLKTATGRLFVETIDCQPIRNGNGWIIAFLRSAPVATVVIDGSNGQELLQKEIKAAGIKTKVVLPTVKEVVIANNLFDQEFNAKNIVHCDQPSLTQSVSNCEKRYIGNNGGFGYKSLDPKIEIGLMESMIFALWACVEGKESKKQKISY